LSQRYMSESDPYSRQFADAKLALTHPRRPASELATLFIAEYFERRDIEEAQARLPSDPKALTGISIFFTRTIAIAKRSGRMEDAERIERLSHQLFPSGPWRMRPQSR